jgi:carbon-monoxide dehydrogenase medium subunit
MPAMRNTRSVLMPASLEDAVAAVAERRATPLAGATWIMRAPVRGEKLDAGYVRLAGLPELRGVELTDGQIAIGAAVTHAELCSALAGLADFRGLAQAAKSAANPAIREVATVGGNLCATAFAAADLAPALLALDAEAEIATPSGARRWPIGAFLAERATWPPGWLLTRVFAARSRRASAHARLPLRRAGDYPVAIVSVALDRQPDGRATKLRIAVGSVESFARRWTSLEEALEGHILVAETAAQAARERIGDFQGRDGIEAPGWYRTEVLPSLVRAAFQAIEAHT